MGGVKPLTGVNLDDKEWCMLTANFEAIKDFLCGNKNALQNVFILHKECEGGPEMKITYELRVPPENTELMNLVLVESMDKNIQAESKANCETCEFRFAV